MIYCSPDGEKENNPPFISACQQFESQNYLAAARRFKKLCDTNREKKWYLINYATSIRNVGYIDFSLRIYEWLQSVYPNFRLLTEIFNRTIEVSHVVSRGENPCSLLNALSFRPSSGFPSKNYLVDEDFHNVTMSLCMIARNESHQIAKAIESALPIVDEVIVVDTGSVDDTVKVAESLGAKVYFHPWNDDFSEARNTSLKYANKDWILVLDADETISYQDLFYIKELIRCNKQCWGFTLDQRDYFNHHVFRAIDTNNDCYEESKPFKCYKVQRICRIFRNSEKIHFSYPVYEIVEESIKLNGGEFGYSDIPIHHYGRLLESEKLLDKRKYYIRILKDHLDSDESGKRKAIYCANISRAYSFLGEHQEGFTYLKRAIEYDPESPFIYVDLGTNAMMRQEFFEAISWFEKAFSLDNRSSETHFLKAQCYYMLGSFEEAKEEMVSYLKSNPGDPNALDLLSKMDG